MVVDRLVFHPARNAFYDESNRPLVLVPLEQNTLFEYLDRQPNQRVVETR